MALCLFSYLGVETAAVAAAKVRDPERNVPKSTIYGTLASAVVYLLSLIAVFGILPATAPGAGQQQGVVLRRPPTRSSAAPGPATWSPLAVIISGIGALNGWTMICAEMPLAAAKDGLVPEAVRRSSRPRGCRPSASSRRPLLASVAVRDQLLGHQRRHGVHDPGPDDRHHRGHPVRVLRARPASSGAPARPRSAAHAPLSPRR